MALVQVGFQTWGSSTRKQLAKGHVETKWLIIGLVYKHCLKQETTNLMVIIVVYYQHHLKPPKTKTNIVDHHFPSFKCFVEHVFFQIHLGHERMVRGSTDVNLPTTMKTGSSK